MKREEIKEKVIAIVCDKLCADDVTEETYFRKDLNTDSLDEVELCMDFEKEFDIRIDDEKLDSDMTVGDAIGLIDQIVND